jgi:hypothetical protein
MGLKLRLLRVPYTPQPDERSFLHRAEVRQDDDLVVRVSVLDDRESERFFGVPLARRGIQPVWLEISNKGDQPYRLRLASLDPNYYPPLEAAFANHFHIVRRLVGFGLLACWFLPFLIVLPFKVLGARAANRRMNAFFEEHGIGSGLIRAGQQLAGFVFTSLDEGTKQFSIRLLGAAGVKDFAFSIPVPGLRVDHHSKQFDALANSGEAVECDEAELRKQLEALPRSTANKRGTAEGDPLNLVAIGNFSTILNGFGARWDETETISLKRSDAEWNRNLGRHMCIPSRESRVAVARRMWDLYSSWAHRSTATPCPHMIEHNSNQVFCFRAVTVPMLFLSNTRDDLADMDLQSVCKRLGKRATLHCLDTADHGFRTLKRSRKTEEDVFVEMARIVREWTSRLK